MPEDTPSCDGYTKETGRERNRQPGASLSLLDVSDAVLKASGHPY